MNTQSLLSLKRIYLLIRRYITLNAKATLIALGGISGFLLLIILVQTYASGQVIYSGFVKTFWAIFFFGGFILTSRIFHELHSPEKSYQYLSLPASTLEKFLSRWLLSSLIYMVVTFLVLGLIGLLGGGLGAGLFGVQFHPLNPLQLDFIQLAGTYWVMQSVFLLGACHFRGHNFLKTLLALFLIGVFIAIFTSLMTKFIMAGQWPEHGGFEPEYFQQVPAFFTVTLPAIAKTFFWYLMAPFFLIVSYFKLKERQV